MAEYIELPKKKPLLCSILEADGAITGEQARTALRELQSRRITDPRVSFGQVVISLGMLRVAALKGYLEMQRKLAGPPGSTPLGVLLIENRILKPRQVIDALERQSRSGKRLGEFLLAEGLVRRIQVDMLLQTQKRAAAARPA